MAQLDLVSIVPDALAISVTIMTGFMHEPTKNFKTFTELVDIFARDQEAVASEGDPSNDLRVLGFTSAMMAGHWERPIVFRRDDGGRVGDGVHRGIAYLRCIDDGAKPPLLPPLLLAPLGSYQWPTGLKEDIEATQA